MRFDRYPRGSSYEITPRKLACAKKAVEKDKESWGLFPEYVKHTTAEERLAALAVHREEWLQDMRDHKAAKWREARRELRALPPLKQSGLRRYWAQCRMPGDPVYLISLVHQAKKGVSYWGKLAYLRRMYLVGQGRLPRPKQWK